VEVLGGHTPLLIVHWNTFTPTPKPITLLFGSVEEVGIPEPETSVQAPVPIVGVFAAITVLLVTHKLWFGPALAVVGLASCWIRTVEVDGGHTPLLIVHAKTLEPTPREVMVVFGEFEAVIIPPPETSDQVPIPTVGVFALMVAVVAQIVWLGPAEETVGLISR
jgi:hypothetical protein